MKVRPSVKKMCEKCKVIRRHGRVHGDLREPAPQAAPGLTRKASDGTYRRRRHPPREAAGDLAHLHLRHRPADGAEDLCADLGLDPNTKVSALTDDEVNQIRTYVDENLRIEGDLRRDVQQDIKRKIEIGCLQGIRHRKGLPVRGQRTHTNARTRKGPKRTVANKKKAVRK